MRFIFFKGTEQGDILKRLRALDPNTSSLILSYSGLGFRSGAELEAIMRLFSPGLRSLDLSWNNFGLKSAQELVAMIRALPQGLMDLDLEFNGFGSKTDDELIEIFSAFEKSTITRLRIEVSITQRPGVMKVLNDILTNNHKKSLHEEEPQVSDLRCSSSNSSI